ncbi:rRNA (guanine-N2)-methyltransferase [Spirochaetia bacterium]|nr:rRNA (guanine-N2)-methyltransferase [Spirochaetia bacterium]
MTDSPKTTEQMEMLANRLRKRQRHLAKWALRTGAGVYRLYHRDIPEIPLVLDFYRSSENAVSGAIYKREYEPGTEEAGIEENELVKNTVAEALCLDKKNVFIKTRRKQRTDQDKQDQYQKESNINYSADIEEGGLKFRVNLSDYIDTGIFPDLRKERALIRAEAENKKVLNLFCYSAAFSVYAAAGGAKETCSVDMSSTYLEWAKTNFILNGFSSTNNHLLKADALRFIDDAKKNNERWDIIILDPPAFSNSKKMKGNMLGGTLDIKRDYKKLIASTLKLLSHNGRLYFSSGVKSFNPDTAALQNELIFNFPNIKISSITEKIRDEDFKGRRMPLCLLITV